MDLCESGCLCMSLCTHTHITSVLCDLCVPVSPFVHMHMCARVWGDGDAEMFRVWLTALLFLRTRAVSQHQSGAERQAPCHRDGEKDEGGPWATSPRS